MKCKKCNIDSWDYEYGFVGATYCIVYSDIYNH